MLQTVALCLVLGQPSTQRTLLMDNVSLSSYDEYFARVSFTLNSLSKIHHLIKPELKNDKIYFDLAKYEINVKVYDEFMERSPLGPQAGWFLDNALQYPNYYNFLGVNDHKGFLQLIGYDYRTKGWHKVSKSFIKDIPVTREPTVYGTYYRISNLHIAHMRNGLLYSAVIGKDGKLEQGFFNDGKSFKNLLQSISLSGGIDRDMIEEDFNYYNKSFLFAINYTDIEPKKMLAKKINLPKIDFPEIDFEYWLGMAVDFKKAYDKEKMKLVVKTLPKNDIWQYHDIKEEIDFIQLILSEKYDAKEVIAPYTGSIIVGDDEPVKVTHSGAESIWTTPVIWLLVVVLVCFGVFMVIAYKLTMPKFDWIKKLSIPKFEKTNKFFKLVLVDLVYSVGIGWLVVSFCAVKAGSVCKKAWFLSLFALLTKTKMLLVNIWLKIKQAGNKLLEKIRGTEQ